MYSLPQVQLIAIIAGNTDTAVIAQVDIFPVSEQNKQKI